MHVQNFKLKYLHWVDSNKFMVVCLEALAGNWFV